MKLLFTPGPVIRKKNKIDKNYTQNEKIIKSKLQEINNILLSLVCKDFEKDYEVVLFSSSSSGAAESVLSSIGYSKILNIVNGKFGERLYDISKVYKRNAKKFSTNSGEIYGLDLNLLKKELEEHNYTFATAVYVEETTGILNNIKKIGTICADNNTKLIVDASSAIGTLDINMRFMNISALFGCFDKSIEGPQGLSFVIIEKSLLEKISKNKNENFYLNINDQIEFFKEHGKLRFSPSIDSIVEVHDALQKLIEEGVEERYERYKDIWQEIIEYSQKYDIEYVVPIEKQSKLITAFHEPKIKDFSFDDFFDYLESKDIIIHPGKLDDLLTFRISNMGQLKIKDVYTLFREIKNWFLTLEFL